MTYSNWPKITHYSTPLGQGLKFNTPQLWGAWSHA